MGWVDAISACSLTGATAAALLSATLCPHQSDGYTPVLAELICWALIIAIFELLQRFSPSPWESHGALSTPSLTHLYWVAAVSIAVVATFSSFADSLWVVPVVALVLIARRRTSLLTRFHESLPEYVRYTWLVCAIGAALLAALVPSLEIETLAFAVPTALGVGGIYTSLLYILGQDYDQLDGGERAGIRRVVFSIASRAIGLLAIVGIVLEGVWPGSTLAVTNAALAGGLKAAHWIAIFYVAQEMPWETAPTIWAYVATSPGSFTPATDGPLGIVLSFSRMVVAVLILGQIVDFIPKTEKGRRLLGVFVLWPLLSLIQHTPLSSHSPSLPGVPWPKLPDQSPHHPIELIIRKAQQDFDRLVSQQSKTLQSAEAEYRKRYSRDPPSGFDKWFSYAQSKQSILIDNFDMINEDLKPFWKIAPHRLLESVDHVSHFDHLALRKCGFTNGQYHGQGGGWIVEDLGKLLEEVSKDIPNVDFAFDVVDEPRVVITQHMLDIGGVSKPEFQDANHKSIWDRTTGPCVHTTLSDNTAAVHDYGLSFVQDWRRAKDVCSHPEFGLMHVFFSSPMTCMLTDAPIPVLSQSAPSSFGDIMYPSPWYPAKVNQGDYKDGEDPPWEQKAKNLYWAGSTTGSYSWNSSWQYAHRQRFVKMVQTLNHTNHMYLKEFQPGQWASYKEIEDHSDLFDVKLTAIIQYDDKDCEEQANFFTLGEKEDRSQQFHSQFIFDADGNSFSGRFYTLLQSRSAVLKQTVLREWHDERLVPWVHFIPVSLSMDELPELMRYMTSHEDGRKRAKEIADAGREWHGKVLRKEDFTIYLYRLMLELARIMDPAREVEK